MSSPWVRGGGGGLGLDLEGGIIFVDDSVVDKFITRFPPGPDADHIRGGGLEFDAGDLDLGGTEVGKVFPAHEGRMEGLEEAPQAGISAVGEQGGFQFLDLPRVPVVSDHLAPVGALHVAKDGGERIVVFPVGGWSEGEVGRCGVSGWSAHNGICSNLISEYQEG